jgi:hypothetical protein
MAPLRTPPATQMKTRGKKGQDKSPDKGYENQRQKMSSSGIVINLDKSTNSANETIETQEIDTGSNEINQEYSCPICIKVINDVTQQSIGCIVCREWFHTRCLKLTAVFCRSRQSKSYVCAKCVEDNKRTADLERERCKNVTLNGMENGDLINNHEINLKKNELENQEQCDTANLTSNNDVISILKNQNITLATLCSDVREMKVSIQFMSDLYDRVDKQDKEIEELKERVKYLETNMKNHNNKNDDCNGFINRPINNTDSQHQILLRENLIYRQIIVSNVPEIEGENIEAIAELVVNKLGIDDNDQDRVVEKSKRFSIKTKDGSSKSFLEITLKNQMLRSKAVASSKKLKLTLYDLDLNDNIDIMQENKEPVLFDEEQLKSNVYVNENISRYTRYILNNAIRIKNNNKEDEMDNGISAAWTYNDAVYIKKKNDNRAIRIFDLNHLNSIIE